MYNFYVLAPLGLSGSGLVLNGIQTATKVWCKFLNLTHTAFLSYLCTAGVQCMRSGFLREVDEMCALLGYYAASSGNYYRRLGPTFKGQ